MVAARCMVTQRGHLISGQWPYHRVVRLSLFSFKSRLRSFGPEKPQCQCSQPPGPPQARSSRNRSACQQLDLWRIRGLPRSHGPGDVLGVAVLDYLDLESLGTSTRETYPVVIRPRRTAISACNKKVALVDLFLMRLTLRASDGKPPNAPATRRMGRVNCNHDAHAGLDAMMG